MLGLRVGKRARSDSGSSASSADSASSTNSVAWSPPPFNKIQRADPITAGDSTTAPLECALPPTCFPEPRSFSSVTELERHQLAFHTHICRTLVRDKTGSTSQRGTESSAQGVWDVPREFTSRHGGDKWRECRKVFPDERLLDLHELECHDPVIRQKQRDGLAVFQCFVPPPTCTRTFINPKHRRLHLIDKHKYPKQYYFSITNHGLNRIAEEEGLGASLIRPRREYPASPPQTADILVRSQSFSPKETVDIDMEDLTKGMKQLESSLSFVPIQLRRKGKGKGKMGAVALGGQSQSVGSDMTSRVDIA